MPRIAEYSLKASTQYTTTLTLDKWKFVCQEEEVSASVEVKYLKFDNTVCPKVPYKSNVPFSQLNVDGS